MNLSVNGQVRELADGATVADLLADLGLGSGWVVIELNRAVVERPQHTSTVLVDGDVVEVVKAVAGG